MTDTMPRCATCKHWDVAVAGEEAWEAVERSNERYGAEVDEDQNVCRRITDAAREATAYGRGQYLDGVFATREDFGCTLHTPKEPS